MPPFNTSEYHTPQKCNSSQLRAFFRSVLPSRSRRSRLRERSRFRSSFRSSFLSFSLPPLSSLPLSSLGFSRSRSRSFSFSAFFSSSMSFFFFFEGLPKRPGPRPPPKRRGSQPSTVRPLSTSTITRRESIFFPSPCL